MATARNFNNQLTGFQYDSFWRLVGVVKPGDSDAFPTVTYQYRPGDPFRHLYYNYAPSGIIPLCLLTMRYCYLLCLIILDRVCSRMDQLYHDEQDLIT